jgi:uncharacterized protein YdhG (YjbR/CyaY superfamily)
MPNAIDAYIKTFPKEVQKKLQEVRRAIADVAPGATEAMGYGVPTFKLNGNLVHFAGYAKHIGFYPGAAGIAAFAKELESYKHAKGSVQFSLDQPLPLTLIKKITKFRVKQQLAQ